MTIHYHSADVNPISKFMELVGCHFIVSHAYPTPVARAHRYGQGVLLDNGAFTAWRLGKPPDWKDFYSWADRWLDHATTDAIIPDSITGDLSANDRLLAEWPFGTRGWPVWHLHEPIGRLLHLLDSWPKVCFGSSGQYAEVLSVDWCRRVDAAFNQIASRHRRTPWIHMLRGMQCVRREWPFASVDSSDVARNHNRGVPPEDMARRWDQLQCPAVWHPREELALGEPL